MKSLVTFFLIMLSLTTLADATRDGNWVGLFQKRTLTDESSLWTEVQFRYNLDAGSMGQTLVRFGGLKKLNNHHEVGLLMGYIQTELLKEYRPTLQHGYQFEKIGNLLLSTRTRLELRKLEDNPEESLRLRPMLRGQFPLTEKVAGVVWNELFINLTQKEWTGRRTLERNRAFAGVRVPHQSLNFEVGYLNQFIPRKSDVTEHILVLYLFY
jgi:hypothetical protein